MKKRILALLLAVALTAGVFSGCRKSTVTALYFAVEGAASGFDPQIAAAGVVSTVVRNCFEGLVRIDEAGEAHPAAADRWEISPDGTKYTFYLRKGAVWHVSDTARSGLAEKLPENFAPAVTADDFVFALRRAVDPATGARQAGLLRGIAGAQQIMAGEQAASTLGVRALDENTLQISLTAPEAGFLETLAEPLCMPCNRTFFAATGGRYGLLMKYIISNGPFYLTRFEDTSFRMARSGDYNGPNPAKTDVIWLYGGDTRAEALQNLADGDYQGVRLMEYEARAAALKNAVEAGAGDTLRALLLNPKNEDLANADLRKALFAASDTAALCEPFGKTPAESFLPACLTGQEIFQNQYSVETASALLQSALAALEKSSVSLTLLCEEAFDPALRRFLQNWQKAFGVGCAVRLEAVPAAELARRVQAGEYDIAFYPVDTPFYTPWAYLSRFSAAGERSVVPLENEDYDASLSSLRNAWPNADEALKQAERILMEQNVLLPVWQEGAAMLLGKDVQGVKLLSGADRLYLYEAENTD